VQGTPSGAGHTGCNWSSIRSPPGPITCNALSATIIRINQAVEYAAELSLGTNNMDAYHAAHPNQPNVGSEQGSTVSTRGIYTNDAARGYVSAYDDNAQKWSTRRGMVSFFDPRPWLSGGFIWRDLIIAASRRRIAGRHQFALRHPGHVRLSQGQLLVLSGVVADQPVLHLLPHWNWRQGGRGN